MLEIRKQGALLSEYLTLGQLTSLLQTVITVVSSIFSLSTLWLEIGMNSGRADNGHGYLLMTDLFGVGFLLIRLYFKFSVAQEVTNAVSSLG